VVLVGDLACALLGTPRARNLCYGFVVSGDGREATEIVATYVRSLRARASSLYAVRAGCAALGVSSAYLVILGGLTGPVVTPLFSHLALALLLLLAGGVLTVGMWPVRRLRGIGSCNLLAQREPVLASRVRSALELGAGATASTSPELVAAHARAVRDAVAALPAAQVVPLSWLKHRSVGAGLGGLLLCVLLMMSSDALQGGARALLHPAEVHADGLRVAPVIAAVRARLVYPSYLGLKASELLDPTVIEAPRGTTVELVVTPRLAARQAKLALGDTHMALSAAPNGQLVARFVAHESAPLALRLYSDGNWYEDKLRRRLKTLDDHRPEVELQLPEATGAVEVQDSVQLRWKASDDHALSVVELVVRAQTGQEQRTRLWSSLAADKPQRTLQDESFFVPAELGAEPGDVLLIWLEARDGDVVSGPNVGTSKSVNLEIATDAQQLSLRLPLLREVLDGALGSLADRLETGVPEQAVQAEQRFQELHEQSQVWIGSLQKLIAATRQRSDEHGLDAEQLQGVLDRTRRELTREAGIYTRGGAAHKQRVDADARVVAEHERDVLLLADSLAQGLVDEARSLTHELSELKNHIAELLQKARSHKTPESERALLAEIAKAQRRLRELVQSLARLSNRVPSEFINREALPQNDAKGALDQLRASVESGNLDDAERQLEALAQQIDQLSEHIEKGGARFREAHFGAHDQAVAEARRQIGALAAEQSRLSERSHELVKRAADRAKSQAREPASGAEMQRSADELQRDLEGLRDADPSAPEAPWLERARARIEDAADAMRTGDMAEARGMSAAAGNSLDQAASSLEQDARMFPGAGGSARQRADAAGAAANKLRRLQKQIEQATPQLGQYIGEPERRQMRGDVDPQARARQQAEALQSQMGRGPDGTPLSPDGERGLQQAADAMRRAERSLERGDPQGASLAQQDASERLHQLEERLGKKGGGGSGQQQAGGRESARRGGREGDGGDPRGDAHVRIPGADEFSGPVQMRRRLLDAMREQAPAEFKSAVERYYEELLR
jgi:hypothetical protein